MCSAIKRISFFYRILTLGANVGTVCEILVELVPQLDDVSIMKNSKIYFLMVKSVKSYLLIYLTKNSCKLFAI